MARAQFMLSMLCLAALAVASTLVAARCPAGTARLDARNPNACKPCPPGTYRDAWKPDQSCISCPSGTFQPHQRATHVSLCRWCPRNSYSSTPSSASCTRCPSSSSSGYGATSCVKCALGQVASFFGNSCRTCPPATYVASVETTADGRPLFDCIDCPSGTYSARGSTSVSQCKPCKKGQRCYACPANTYFVRTGDCVSCPSGTQSPVGSASIADCKPCPKNSARPFGSKASCTSCKSGTTAPASGAAACKSSSKCPSGTALSTSGSCISCPPGSRLVSSSKGAACVACAAGAVSPGGLSEKCQTCTQGTVPDAVAKSCVCSAGQYLSKTGACAKCPAGTAQTELLHTYRSCDHCDVGTVASNGASRCTRCPDGLVANSDQSACTKCPANLMPDLLTETDLLEGRSHSKCVSTSSGCTSPTSVRQGSQKYAYCDPVVCSPGTPSGDVGKVCEGCAAGEFVSKDWRGIYVCESCPEDSTTTGGVVASCKKCPNGLMRDENRGNKCTCSGLYSLGYGLKNGKCQKCAPNTFSTFDMDQCSPCEPGTYAPKPGAWRCRK